MRIAILPLDDRPQTCGFAAPLARIGGVEPLLPPRALLGHFLTPGRCDELAAWLLEAGASANAVVVALDMLAYGGLVAARTAGAATAEQATARLQALRTLRERRPGLPIYAASGLTRLSITAASPESVRWWARVHRWFELHEPRTPAEQAERDRLRAEIPPGVLADFVAARRRNHGVNRLALDLLAEGVLTYLLLSQEDCSERGPHRAEQAALLAHAGALGVLERMTLCPGADEGCHVLLARAALNLRGLPAPAVQVVWSDPAGAERVAPFEDRPVRATLAGLMQAVGARPAPGPAAAGLTLYVHVPGEQPADLGGGAPPAPRDLEPFVAALAADLAAGRPAGLADVAAANGADPALAALLRHVPAAARLAGYAAWNTCANTLGTVLAHALLRGLGANADREHCAFLLARLADDGAYQPLVRGLVNRWLEARGLCPWHLPAAAHREAAAAVRALLEPAVRDLHRDVLGRQYRLAGVRITLDWPRTFEVHVQADLREVAGAPA